ncbi:MAG: GGDEF domain-containing protein [Lachnospiraceae bacterium]|nr:GGDEF domain-containing protein [Lachnospiraceae bacterium]
MKIALFVGQIYMYSQSEVIKGIYNECKKNNDELHLFSFYVSNDFKFDLGEYEYIRRMDLDGFDGFILYASAFYSPYIRGLLVEKVKSAGKPCVSIDSYDKDFINISSCNDSAMEELVEHIITKHNVRTINFVGGPNDSNDAKLRLEACRTVMKRYGLKLDDKRICSGNYFVDSGYKAYDYFQKNGLMDADAFVCINDQTAMGVFFRLEEAGYKVPQDYIITGFDHIPQAYNSVPSITSVERFEGKVGETAYKQLVLGTKEDIKIVPRLFTGTSCCKDCDANENKRDLYLKECIKRLMDDSRYIGYVSDCNADFMKFSTVKELYESLPDYQKKYNIPRMSIVIDKNEERRTMEIPYNYDISQENPTTGRIKRNQIFKGQGEGNVYIYSSLHYSDIYYGYIICTNYFEAINNELHHIFINSISNAYESVKKFSAQAEYISQLKDLSYYDPLTKLYNRLGFFETAEEKFELAKKEKRQMYIIFADMDRLKIINDTQGHKKGDSYIADFANILSDSIDETDTVMRFGGDEFVVFGSAESISEVKEQIKLIQDEIIDFNKKGKYSPYILSVSMGYTMIPYDTKKTLYSFIEAADVKMYQAKKEKRESRSGKDRRSGRDRRVCNRRGMNSPLDLSEN